MCVGNFELKYSNWKMFPIPIIYFNKFKIFIVAIQKNKVKLEKKGNLISIKMDNVLFIRLCEELLA